MCVLSINISILLLFEGKNDASKNAASVMDSVEVSSKLESEDFVAIKLDSGSEGYRQFAQICILCTSYLECEFFIIFLLRAIPVFLKVKTLKT
jgi:hypothetical protein